MDEQAFRRLVAEHEHACRHDPQRFTRDTAMLAGLGQAMILGLLALAAAGLLWSLGGLLVDGFRFWRLVVAAACGSLLLSIGGALWMRQRPPVGRVVARGQAPALFELIDRLQKRCGAPAIEQVLVDAQLNAAMVQQPRLGVLGWHRNTLVLGLPLLMALDVRQLAAVIAHEFGHLRGGHGKLGAWVYRTRRSWWLLARSRQRSRFGASLADLALNLFFEHFFPRFNARAFVLSRQQEVEADRLARMTVGAGPAAQGLISLAVQSRFLVEQFWPRVYAQADRQPEPQAHPMRDMRIMLKDSLRDPAAPDWLRQALKTLPDASDTHPSLRDRLEQAEVAPQLPPPPAMSAADQLLGPALPVLIQVLDEQWRADVIDDWHERHRQHRQRERLLVELAEEDAAHPLDPGDRLLWARTAWQVQGAAAAVPVLRGGIQPEGQAPAEARYLLGCALLESVSPVLPRTRQPEPPEALTEALQWLQQLSAETSSSSSYMQAKMADPQWRLPAAQRLEQALEQREDFDGLKRVRQRIRELADEAQAAQEELNDFDGEQHIEADRVTARGLRPTLDLLAREPAVGRAFLLRKTHPRARGWALHLLVIERAQVIGQPDVEHWWQDLRARINLPFELMVIDLAHPYWTDIARADLVQQFKQCAGACIYTARTAKTA